MNWFGKNKSNPNDEDERSIQVTRGEPESNEFGFRDEADIPSSIDLKDYVKNPESDKKPKDGFQRYEDFVKEGKELKPGMTTVMVPKRNQNFVLTRIKNMENAQRYSGSVDNMSQKEVDFAVYDKYIANSLEEGYVKLPIWKTFFKHYLGYPFLYMRGLYVNREHNLNFNQMKKIFDYNVSKYNDTTKSVADAYHKIDMDSLDRRANSKNLKVSKMNKIRERLNF